MNEPIPFGVRSTADEVLAGIDLSHRRILVTGCNSAIGFETMNALAANGAHVIGLARTLEKATVACEAVGPSSTPIACDLADLHSVASAANAIRHMPGHLDAIITHAEAQSPSTLQTRHGVELQFLVDHIGHFSLVNALADLVRDDTGRIVIVSSDAGVTRAPAEGVMFDNLDGHRFYDPVVFYAQAKFATALYAKELSRRLAGRRVAVNALHPGTTSGAVSSASWNWPRRMLRPLVRLFSRSPAQAAATPALLAASPRVAGITGEYWAECQIAEGNPLLVDKGLAQRLWEFSEHFIAAHGPRAGNALSAAA